MKSDIIEALNSNLNKINKFDQLVDALINTLETLEKSNDCQNTFRAKLKNQIASLKNIESAHSQSVIMPFIYQQELILIVSYLEAFMKDYFSKYCEINFENVNHEKIKSEFSLSDLKEIEFNIKKIGELILKKDNKFNFQNLKSIQLTLSELFDIKIEDSLNNFEIKRLKYFLECRHVLVHKGGIIDEKYIKETGLGKIGQSINISADDIKELKGFVMKLGASLVSTLPGDQPNRS